MTLFKLVGYLHGKAVIAGCNTLFDEHSLLLLTQSTRLARMAVDGAPYT